MRLVFGEIQVRVLKGSRYGVEVLLLLLVNLKRHGKTMLRFGFGAPARALSLLQTFLKAVLLFTYSGAKWRVPDREHI